MSQCVRTSSSVSLAGQGRECHISLEISVVNSLLLCRSRIIIPPTLKETMLEKLHSSHQGVTKCRERARQSVWWPGLPKELEDRVHKCPDWVCENQDPASQVYSPTTNSNCLSGSRNISARCRQNRLIDNIGSCCTLQKHHGIPETLISDNAPRTMPSLYILYSLSWANVFRSSFPNYSC